MPRTSPSLAISRRSLLVAGTGAAVAAALATPTSVLAKGKRFVTRTHLRRSSYQPLIGSDFNMRGASDSKIPLKLVEVADTAWPPKPSVQVQEKAFELIFDGPIATPLSGGTYSATHPDLGRFDLAISEGVPEGPAWRYVATFNNVKVGLKKKHKKPKARKSKSQRGDHAGAARRRKAHSKAADKAKKPEAPKLQQQPSEPAPAPSAEYGSAPAP